MGPQSENALFCFRDTRYQRRISFQFFTISQKRFDLQNSAIYCLQAYVTTKVNFSMNNNDVDVNESYEIHKLMWINVNQQGHRRRTCKMQLV